MNDVWMYVSLTGVHCTHGFNRTGYMLASYFCEVEEWSIEDAAHMFAMARPPGKDALYINGCSGRGHYHLKEITLIDGQWRRLDV